MLVKVYILTATEMTIPAAVKIIPKMSPFLAILLSSFLSTKYMINPPMMLRNIGNRYQAFVGFCIAVVSPSAIEYNVQEAFI